MVGMLEGRITGFWRYLKSPLVAGELVSAVCRGVPFALLEVVSAKRLSSERISEREARQAGFADAEAVLKDLHRFCRGERRRLPLWKVRFRILKRRR